MEPWHQDDQATIYHGDCIEVLRGLPDASVDSVVTDPPYDLTNRTVDVLGCSACGRTLGGSDGKPHACPRCGGELSRQRSAQGKGFMGKEWDGTGVAFRADTWRECLRVLKPGGHLLAFGGTRTWHRLAVAVEDAGFEVRDSIAWMYGSGFPKSLDVSKAIDKAAGAERTQRVGVKPGHEAFVGKDNLRSLRESGSQAQEGGFSRPWMHDPEKVEAAHYVTAPATPDAARWSGWGTALKPAFEPVVVARKPLTGTVAANVLEHGVGGLNIDGCRIGTSGGKHSDATRKGSPGDLGWGRNEHRGPVVELNAGRWPANVVLDEDQADALDKQSGTTTSAGGKHSGRSGTRDAVGGYGFSRVEIARPTDTGGASRFFYVAKAPARERPKVDGIAHPTVKPLTLMRWLCRLVTPPGGTVLEPFAGSGTTIEAALMEGFHVIAIEREDDYLPLIAARLERVHQEPDDGQLTFDASA